MERIGLGDESEVGKVVSKRLVYVPLCVTRAPSGRVPNEGSTPNSFPMPIQFFGNNFGIGLLKPTSDDDDASAHDHRCQKSSIRLDGHAGWLCLRFAAKGNFLK